MRVRVIVIVSFALLLAVGRVTAQNKTTVFGTAHDVAAAGCSSCHVPHQATAKGRTLLWNQNFSTQIFGTYTSSTMDSTAAEIGSATYSDTNPPTGDSFYSVLCMSCHDGITSTLITATDPHAIGNPTNSDGLRNDHPVNMAWPTGDAGIRTTTEATTAGVTLYGATNTVQCGSCHNPHDNTLTPFLRVANTNNATGLCAACHV